jgi:hypothetical protein
LHSWFVLRSHVHMIHWRTPQNGAGVGTSGETAHPGDVLQVTLVQHKWESLPQFGYPEVCLATPVNIWKTMLAHQQILCVCVNLYMLVYTFTKHCHCYKILEC